MRNAHHVLHMYNLAAEEAIEESDLVAGGLFLEFMERGTLEKWIVKMAKERKTFSDGALWNIFDCLARGLVALAYPEKDWRVEESAMMFKDDPVDPMVHFDIDPTNSEFLTHIAKQRGIVADKRENSTGGRLWNVWPKTPFQCADTQGMFTDWFIHTGWNSKTHEGHD